MNSYFDVPREAFDFAQMLATQGGGGGAGAPPAPVQVEAKVAAPPPYEPPPLNLEQAHDDWLTRAMRIIGAAGSRIEPSAFIRSRDKRTASIISAIMGGVGSAGAMRREAQGEGVARRNQETLAKYQGREAAARATHQASAETTARETAQQPFTVAAEDRARGNAEYLKMVDMLNSIGEHKANAMFDTGNIGNVIDATTEANLRNHIQKMVKGYGLMSPADAAQFDQNALLFNLKKDAAEMDLVPSDTMQQFNLMRQIGADLRRSYMSIAAQSRDPRMQAEVEKMKLQADAWDRQVDELRGKLLEAGNLKLATLPPEKQKIGKLLLEGMFSDAGAREATMADAASSIVADDQAWVVAKHDERLQAMRNEFAKAMATDDIGALYTYVNNIGKRMRMGFGTNKEMTDLYNKLLQHVAAGRPKASTPTPRGIEPPPLELNMDRPAAEPDSTRLLTPDIMDNSVPGEDEYTGYERRQRRKKKGTP